MEVAVAVVEVGIVEAEAEATALIETVMIHFTLVLITTILNLTEMTTMGTTGVAMLVVVITHIHRAHIRHELPTKSHQRTRDIVALMVKWEGPVPPTTTVAMGKALTPEAAMLLQTPTVVVMITVRYLVQTTTMRTGMEKAVVTADMEDTGMMRLLISLVIPPEVVLQAIMAAAHRRAGTGVEGGDHLFLQRCSYIHT
jgi:hypothetical protein